LTGWGGVLEIVDVEREMEDRGMDSIERVEDKRGNRDDVSADFEGGYEGTGRKDGAGGG
jgi:hypothetical protein